MKPNKMTKIVCTIGPASEKKEILSQMIDAGMNVARLNFSHGDYEEHGKRIETIRTLNEEKNASVAILLDTKGPEIRTHKFENGGVDLKKDQKVKISMKEVLGTQEIFSVTYPNLIDDVEIGNKILVDDGYLTLEVLSKTKDIIECKVLNSAFVKDRRGINVPNVKLNMPFISKKDLEDLKYGCKQEVDFVAASFVRRKDDILEIRKIFESVGASGIQIIAKIENEEGVKNAAEILEVADGIMVARGDLGVEVPAEEVPVIQKKLIKICQQAGKVVVTATQMLESMQKNPRPTRAEVSDVANAILDGTDAIMLSGESAAGDYPIEAVKMMTKIASRTEQEIDYEYMVNQAISSSQRRIISAIALSTVDCAATIDAKVIVASTVSGETARIISRYRPNVPILALATSRKTARSLAITWGVDAQAVEKTKSTDDLLEQSISFVKEHYNLSAGDIAVITAGLPVGQGRTNLMKVHIIE